MNHQLKKSREERRLLVEPIFVIGCNRSGTTILFKTLSSHPSLWSHYTENRQDFLRTFPGEGPEGHLVLEATPRQARKVERFLYRNAKNRELAIGFPLLEQLPRKLFQHHVTRLFKSSPLTVVDKTPSNCFRVTMLASAFPDARFVYIVRRGEAVVSSLMEGWKNWTETEGAWRYRNWHYLKPPGWMDYRDRSLEKICAFQFVASNLHAIRALEEVPEERHITVRHEDLVSRPMAEYTRLREFLALEPSTYWHGIVSDLKERVWTRGGSPPQPGKWRRLHGTEVERIRDRLAPINEQFYDGDEHLDTA